ncbi:hypothetical protein NAEGRDRAFT_79661 [Naegleria gruberi]|uniref:Uncharacterized protein n=1 Tax=Naegleria gruberi TaxID=5762 RepID=D2VEI0_NAEGR|nr:uncharacterized protein NAEGRDRAFT_79661 [Naegleria gruberi]EFC44803.1 hypothetical protein NAEGRDRAFT_79661 [Naegleria gruberi]|eukprot:XP_002677547.1 hypothetical protein NAEGRDRAFT_79661 [Naegleria gruberi strain NEG-M]
MTQIYPEDVLSLIYAIHAVNLFVFEQRDVSFKSFEKSLRLLQYDPSNIENLILCLDVAANGSEGSSVLCLSSDGSSSDVYFSSNRDHNSLFLISARLMLSQYCLCLGFIPTASHFLNEADIMLKNRFPTYRNQSYLPSSILGAMVDPIASLYQGLTPDEIFVLKYRLVCGVKLDDIRFFQERLPQYIGYSTPQTFEPYTRTSSVLLDDPKYLFSSYVNKYIFGTALFIIGMGKKDLLNLLLSPNIVLKDQPNIPFMIIGVLDFNGKLLKKLTIDRFKMTESEVSSLTIPTEITHRYADLVFTFQKIFTTSYSFLVLHEVVINYSSPLTLMNIGRNDIDIENVRKCLNFRNEFADELSDLYAVLPDYTIHFISLVVITVFQVAKIHYDKILDSGMNFERKLLTRLKNDFRMLHILRKKFPQLFEHDHLITFYNAIEDKINQISN